MTVDKPNLTLPLAVSYNTRGIAGFTNTITNAIDQRKINSIYEPITNALTGKTTLYLCKRPGVSDSASTFGSSSYVGYLVHRAAGGISSFPSAFWVFATNGNDVQVSSAAATQAIVTAASNVPAYVDSTVISGVDTVVLTTRHTSTNVIRHFFSNAIATWTEITDATLTGLSAQGKMQFMDGYAFMVDLLTSRVHNSDLNSLANWADTGYITKQVVQDPCLGLARLGQQIIAFGSLTMEVFRNAGNPTGSPLEAVPSMFKRYGITMGNVSAQSDYSATLGSRMYFIGNGGGYPQGRKVFAYDGQNVEPVSNPSIDKVITERTPQAIRNCTIGNRQAIGIQLDTAADTTHRWLMFFPDWKEWFEWNSTVWSPIGYAGSFLGVSGKQDKVYTPALASDNYQDAGTNYTMTHQFKLPSEGNNRKFMKMFGVVGDTARSASTLNVEFSDDDWVTFQTARGIDMTSKQKMLTRCGSYSDRGVRLTHTANLDCRLQTVVARVE